MEMDALAAAGLFFAGLGISTVAMAVGIGGGILWTPLLIVAYGLSAPDAVTTSLFIQVLGLGSGAAAYARHGLAAPKLTLMLTAVALPGVVVGSFVSVNLAQHWVQLALGVMAMTLAFLFVATQDAESTDTGAPRAIDFQRARELLPIPAFFGILMGLLSVGIGEWVLPALQHRLKLEMSRAIAIVIPMMFLLALVAALSHWLFSDQFYWEHVLWGGLGTLLGAQLGSTIGRRIKDRVLKEAFIYLMTLVGIHLIFQAV